MKKLQGKRNRLGQPIKCPGLCNSLNENIIDTNTSEINHDCKNRKKQLIILRRLPENLKNIQKIKKTGCFIHYMKIFFFYIILHSLIAAFIRHHKYYPHFLAAQLCGLLTISLFPILNRCRNCS